METQKMNTRSYGITNEMMTKGRKQHWNNERRFKTMF